MESVDAVTVAPSGSLVVDYRKFPGGGIQPAYTQLFDGLGWIQIAGFGHGTSEVPGKGKTVAGRRDGSIWIGGWPDRVFEGVGNGPSLWLWGTNTPVSGPPPTLYPNLAEISCIVELPDNRVAVGLSYATPMIWIWDGSTWTSETSGPFLGLVGQIRDMRVLANGNLIVAGDFDLPGAPGANVAVWDGSVWSPRVCPGFVSSIAELTSGEIVACFGSEVAKWNGSSWSTIGTFNDDVFEALILPNGDLVVAGEFTSVGALPCNRIARWNGTFWSPVGSGVNGPVFALAWHPKWGLIVGGKFTVANGVPSVNLARLGTTCLATANASGHGCPSSGGGNTLVALAPPWVDALFQARGVGLPTTALVLTLTSVTSFPQGLLPLSAAFPQAGAGCDALVGPDILGILVTTTGTATSSIFLPNTPPLVGVTFYHQLVPIELDAQGAWISVTATNALRLTAGTF
ncbi:MAG: hypothetical protein JNK78_12670 [Planctomycetes bacterium]|nr:hypothetical protein [Planctomycetota bacterium]